MKSRSQRIHETQRKISRRLNDYNQIFKIDEMKGSKRSQQPGRMSKTAYMSCNCRKRVKGRPHVSCGICVERGLNKIVSDRRNTKESIRKNYEDQI
jgi:hypothetical protein